MPEQLSVRTLRPQRGLVTAPGVDAAVLRQQRRGRLFAAMDLHDLDVLILGRPASITYASGLQPLWLAGSRPFGPACVVVRAGEAVHLLVASDHGAPADIPHSHLYGTTWNPATLLDELRAIPGLVAARRVGTDASTADLTDLLAAVAPAAATVDGTPAVRSAREIKTPEELLRIEAAVSVAERALRAMTAAVRAGASPRQLLAVCADHLARDGFPIVPTEAVALSASGTMDVRSVMETRRIEPGRLVGLSPTAVWEGYEGGLSRTAVAGPHEPTVLQQRLAQRCRAALDAVTAECRAGRSGADLHRAWTALESPPVLPLAHGLGIGVETPLIAADRGGEAVLCDGMVLAIQGWLAEPDVGGVLEGDVVVVSAAGPRVLGSWPPGLVA